MGQRTGIQWCDDTVNPTTGCDGCELWHLIDKGPCYAGVLHEGRLARSMPGVYAANFTEVRTAPGRMTKAAAAADLRGKDRPGKSWLNGQPRIIFVSDMGDLFSHAIPFEYIRDEVVTAVTSRNGLRHIFLLLTKQPKRAAEFGTWLRDQGIAWPRNLGCGTSVTSTKTLSRLDSLAQVPATFRFASLEPLWTGVSIQPWLDRHDLDWVIVGGESPQAGDEPSPFCLAWLDDLRTECHGAGVPLFVKQYGGAASRSCSRGEPRSPATATPPHHHPRESSSRA